MHRTVVPMAPQHSFIHRCWEAIIALYRRSQHAGDEGRLFIVKNMNPASNELQIGMLRTSDMVTIENMMQARDLFHLEVQEFSEDDIISLFKAA